MYVKSKARQVIRYISKELRVKFRILVWIPRCNRLIVKEKACGITKEMKKSSYESFSDGLRRSKDERLRNKVQQSGLAFRWFDDQIKNGRSACWVPSL